MFVLLVTFDLLIIILKLPSFYVYNIYPSLVFEFLFYSGFNKQKYISHFHESLSIKFKTIS